MSPNVFRAAAALAILTLAGCATSENGARDQGGAAAAGHQARNVILFVGDGMGVSTLTPIRILAGQMEGKSGEGHDLPWDRFPHVALVKTYNTNQQVPDSAGTATAFLAGVKTKAGLIGVGPDARRADCPSQAGATLDSIITHAERAGLATGIVTTARLTHATPAAAYAHSTERDWESDSDMPPEAKAAGCADIAQQFVTFDAGDGIEVALGGGRQNFLPVTAADPEYPELTGVRRDGRDLIAEWRAKYPGGAFVADAAAFDAVEPDQVTHLFGLFEPKHMRFEADRANDGAGEPSLSEMTAKAIAMLQRNPRGYVLLVEGGRIDHGHHENRARDALIDGVELARAVAVAERMTDPDDTLIIVTADHSHTFAMAGYPTLGNPILGKVIGNDAHGEPMTELALADDGKPYTTLGYYIGPGASREGPRPDLTDVNTEAPGYLQQATIYRESAAHGGEDVAAFAKGPNAAAVSGVIEQNLLFHIMMEALGIDGRP